MTLRSRPVRVLLVTLASLALVAVSCGDDDEPSGDDTATTEATGTSPTSDTTEEVSPTDSTDTTTPAEGGGAVEATDSELGMILTSGGRTLYIFLPDDGGAPTCYEECAENWPPLLSKDGPMVGGDLDEALFDTVTRDDGGEQVTVDGWPLYFFANDTEPGDVNGQGVSDVWYVVSPDGKAIEGEMEGG